MDQHTAQQPETLTVVKFATESLITQQIHKFVLRNAIWWAYHKQACDDSKLNLCILPILRRCPICDTRRKKTVPENCFDNLC